MTAYKTLLGPLEACRVACTPSPFTPAGGSEPLDKAESRKGPGDVGKNDETGKAAVGVRSVGERRLLLASADCTWSSPSNETSMPV